jgi:enolase-phosphatase E1
MQVKAIVTDIEGTTTSLSFVKDVLFPYSRRHMVQFVKEHAGEPRVQEQLDRARDIAGRGLNDDQLIEQLIRWIDNDEKIPPLKALQGMIWRAGYENGDFTGHVYPDVVENIQKWHVRGIKLFVFSSGSVQAQKLIFGYSDAGDLTPLFTGFFDTRAGNKREESAYRNITEKIGVQPDAVLFLSDVQEELDAAAAAGMQTVWVVREGTFSKRAVHPQVSSFDEVPL